MPNFIGFNTIDQHKKFTLTDYELIKRDILNALHIRQGELPGRPEIGSNIWEHIFEPLVSQTISLIKNELRTVVERDVRVKVDDIKLFSNKYKVVAEMTITVYPDMLIETLILSFDEFTNSITSN